jgi:CHAT domain-containing protein
LEHSGMAGLSHRLREYRSSGYDRLCIWPHATSHYAPLHLMSVDGRPLADDWLITTIPTIACLLPKADRIAGASSPCPLEITVLAASSPEGGLHAGYPSVPDLEVQAASIVDGHAGSRLLEPGSATPEALLHWMPRSRYVHLAAHGSSDPFAPSYQTLHFTGALGSGALTARALMHADLRNVDLVTLSACESALGRFDVLDNQAGLTAALLGAGVTAVVACLWPVRPEPATHFFVELYQTLAKSGQRPDLRAAFRAAQLATRAEYPAYRDWGAFVYVGGW